MCQVESFNAKVFACCFGWFKLACRLYLWMLGLQAELKCILLSYNRLSAVVGYLSCVIKFDVCF